MVYGILYCKDHIGYLYALRRLCHENTVINKIPSLREGKKTTPVVPLHQIAYLPVLPPFHHLQSQ